MEAPHRLNPVDVDRIIRSKPDWMNASLGRRVVSLRGNSTWKSQPVIDTVRVKLRDDITRVSVNQAMAASWRLNGNKQRNRFVFGDQAGAITKRTNSIINFGNDSRKDVFVFTNNVPGKPFNHMQRFKIKNFSREDQIILLNTGQRFSFKDIRPDGSLPGVPRLSMQIVSFADL